MSKKKKLIIAGANNPETIRLIKEINESGNDLLEIIGWIDNDDKKHGSIYCGYKVLGCFEELKKDSYKDAYIFNNITTNAIIRRETTELLSQFGNEFISLISPSVNTEDVYIGKNVCIQEGAIVQAKSEIHDNAFIYAGSIIGHEAIISNSVFISANVSIGGITVIEENVTIWMSATVGPRITVGQNSIIGMNGSILEDVPKNTTMVSRPSIKLKGS